MTRVIEQFFDTFSSVTGIMMEQRILGALVIMALFAILSLLVDFFIHRIVNYISKKSNVEIDHTFIGSIHRPAWIIILLMIRDITLGFMAFLLILAGCSSPHRGKRSWRRDGAAQQRFAG